MSLSSILPSPDMFSACCGLVLCSLPSVVTFHFTSGLHVDMRESAWFSKHSLAPGKDGKLPPLLLQGDNIASHIWVDLILPLWALLLPNNICH